MVKRHMLFLRRHAVEHPLAARSAVFLLTYAKKMVNGAEFDASETAFIG